MVPFHLGLARTAGRSAAALLLAALALPLARLAHADGGTPAPDVISDPTDPGASPPVDSTRTFLHQWLGLSGNLRAIITTPAQAFGLPVLRALLPILDDRLPGVLDLPLTAPDGQPMRLLSLIPFHDKQGPRLGPYRMGRWPQERRVVRSPYAEPAGFIEVTPENENTPVSKHFRLSDFVTHDQTAVWPKYLVLRPLLLDKLELISEGLKRAGLPSDLHVLSGFRTPEHNAFERRRGLGRRPATDSRHMYGDAADIIVDSDGDGKMDDLDGDGRITQRDAIVLEGIVNRVEEEHPELVGGMGLYPATRRHGPFVHVDVRGQRVRWGAIPAARARAAR